MGASTLVIGLGGLGGRVICLLAERIKRESIKNVQLAILDTDVNDLRRAKEEYGGITVIQTSPTGIVAGALDDNPYARENWFPMNQGLMGKTFTEGAGQVRAISRLAFDHLVFTDKVEELKHAVNELRELNGESMDQAMRIIIVSSIAGGTGSGLVLPVSIFLRDYLEKDMQDTGAIIRGFFLEPDVLFGRIGESEERNDLKANAYAAIRELDAFFKKNHAGDKKELEHVVFNAPESGSHRRKDFGNVLPYNFVFLMDASNMSGKRLLDPDGGNNLDAYLQHAADCIYAQALSAATKRSNSGEDNVIRKLTESYGRSRYCGAGYSCLEYPKEAVQRYIAFTWATQNIADQWMELDHQFEKDRQDDDELKLSSSYVTNYDAMRDNGNIFYNTIMRASERKKKDGNIADIVDAYIDNLTSHAMAWNDKNLIDECQSLKDCLFSDIGTPLLIPLPASDAAVQTRYQNSDTTNDASVDYNDFWTQLRRYDLTVQNEVPKLVRTHARSVFSISDHEPDPLGTRTSDWLVESLFKVERDGKVGTFHPTAVRYYLYRLMARLQRLSDESRDHAEEMRDLMKSAAKADYDSSTSLPEDAPTALSSIFNSEQDHGIMDRIKRLRGRKEALTPEQCQKLGDIGLKLNNYLSYVDQYRENVVLNAFATAALDYVTELSQAYEAFYKYLDRQGLEQIRAEIKAAELNSAYNETQGYAHRYVCASKRCLAEMRERCAMHSRSGDLPIDLCGDIYNDLLKYAKRSKELKDQYGHRNEVSQQLFDGMFQRVIVDYWTEAVMDVRTGYPSIIDKSIVQAIADEALYTSDEVFTDDEERNRFTFRYTRDTLEQACELAEPFIETPRVALPKNIMASVFAENAFDPTTPNAEDIRQLLVNKYSGEAQPAGTFSKYEILFYRSVYGFCATELPKYAPEHHGTEDLAAGEYHDAYYSIVNQLSPDESKNKFVTPHIDRHWHLLSYLPDLNEDFEEKLRRDTVQAFLHGLIFRKFNSQQHRGKDDTFHIVAGKEDNRQIELLVSNGSPCDKFYEIYDALEFSPPAVMALIESSRRRLIEEQNESINPSLEECGLIASIKSRIFEIDDIDEWVDVIAEDTTSAISELVPRMVAREARRRTMSKLKSSRFKNLFNFGIADAPQTSLFEIPLLYRMSLPRKELRQDKLETIVDNTFRVVRDHLMNYSDEDDLDYYFCLLFTEQYLIFERNLVGYELEKPSIHSCDVVNLVREKVLANLSRMEQFRTSVERVQNTIVSAWDAYRERR